jgi:hypothetical protein
VAGVAGVFAGQHQAEGGAAVAQAPGQLADAAGCGGAA